MGTADELPADGAPDPTPVAGPRPTAELHALVEVRPDRLEVRPGPARARLVATFATAAVALVGLGFLHAARVPAPAPLGTAFLLLAGGAFGAAAWALPRTFAPVAIDARLGTFERAPSALPVPPGPERASLAGAVAVQALEVPVAEGHAGREHRRPRSAWQVNLVLAGGRRTNVLVHTGPDRALESAARVARLVGVRVVDQSAALGR